ncbi:hypothetical protein JB92DRAFT_2824567 [Gautieria morchelliformis]|nr:hypothetical protein JB92DRAFT_2824567 [Gautieria morchelliformis]
MSHVSLRVMARRYIMMLEQKWSEKQPWTQENCDILTTAVNLNHALPRAYIGHGKYLYGCQLLECNAARVNVAQSPGGAIIDFDSASPTCVLMVLWRGGAIAPYSSMQGSIESTHWPLCGVLHKSVQNDVPDGLIGTVKSLITITPVISPW